MPFNVRELQELKTKRRMFDQLVTRKPAPKASKLAYGGYNTLIGKVICIQESTPFVTGLISLGGNQHANADLITDYNNAAI